MEPGVETRYCSHNAAHFETRPGAIDPDTHAWGEWALTTAATCSAEGVETRVCGNNPAHTETRPIDIDPTAHAWGEWTVTTAPTCTTAGVETRVCSNNAAHTETRPIAINPDNHVGGTYEAEITAPTYDAEGLMGIYCNSCNKLLSTRAIDKLIAIETRIVTVNESYASNNGEGSYTPGTIVTIRAGTRTGYTFSSWIASITGVNFASVNSAETTFEMPDSNVTVTAQWTAQTPGGGPGGGPGTGGGGLTPPTDQSETEFDDELTPLASLWSFMNLENTGGIVAYDDAEGGINYVRFSFDVGNRIYFFGDKFTEYYLVPHFKTFTDIDKHWAKDEILFSASREVINGYDDGSFKPDEVITRGMFATLLAKLAAIDLSGYSERVFSDVDPESWFGPSLAWAYENGIVSGRGDDTFDPYGVITRQDMTLMIVRFLALMDIDLVENEISGSFTDGDQVAEWAVDAVAQMRNYGIVQGRPGDLFDPWGHATRAEAVVFICRIVESAIMRAIDEIDEDFMVEEQPAV